MWLMETQSWQVPNFAQTTGRRARSLSWRVFKLPSTQRKAKRRNGVVFPAAPGTLGMRPRGSSGLLKDRLIWGSKFWRFFAVLGKCTAHLMHSCVPRGSVWNGPRGLFGAQARLPTIANVTPKLTCYSLSTSCLSLNGRFTVPHGHLSRTRSK